MVSTLLSQRHAIAYAQQEHLNGLKYTQNTTDTPDLLLFFFSYSIRYSHSWREFRGAKAEEE